jgi:hypothetical protein
MTHDEHIIAVEQQYNAMQKEHEAAAWAHGYKPVNKVMIRKWAKALRSGYYKQTTRNLVYQTQAFTLNKPVTPETCAYCATGVLCDLINPLAWFNFALVGVGNDPYKIRRIPHARWWAPMMLRNKRIIHKGATTGKFKYGPMDKCAANVPSGVAMRLLELGISTDEIVRMNDLGESFNEIADRIEGMVL